MRRRDQAEYLTRLAGMIAFGAVIGSHAYARNRLRALKDRLT